MNIREFFYFLMLMAMIFFLCLADYERRQELVSVLRLSKGDVIYNLRVTGNYPVTYTWPEGFIITEGEKDVPRKSK